VLDEHKAILRAIQERSGARAEQLMATPMEKTKTSIVSLLPIAIWSSAYEKPLAENSRIYFVTVRCSRVGSPSALTLP
jgi:hypothetical protein